MTKQEELTAARLYREIDLSHDDIHKKTLRLGKMLAEHFSEDDDSLDDFCLRYDMKLVNVRAYIAVAKNKIYAPLLSSSQPGVRKALALPFLDQKAVWHEGVDVWSPSTQKSERKILIALTEGEASRVFRHNKINTAAQQQRTHERYKSAQTHGNTPYIFQDKIIVGRAAITREQSYDLMVSFWTVDQALHVASRISAKSTKGKKAA